MINKNIQKILLPILILLALGSIFLLWIIGATEKEMRSSLLQQARIAAHAISTDFISSLSGSEKDLDSSFYQHIKSQLHSVRISRQQCKFLYLMGRKPDGKIFFFVDSLPPDSEDYAPPGLIYEEVSDSYIAVFDNMRESVVGPIKDRWGTLITALVPIKSPSTGNLLAVLGMDVEASYWNKEIIRRCFGPVIIIILLATLILLLASRENTLQALRRSEKKLHQRAKFERLINKLSSEFTGLKLNDLDSGINRALASIGTFTGVDRAYVFLFRKDGNLSDNTHEWCADGIEPQIDKLKGISIKEELPRFESHIHNHEIFEIQDVSTLPQEAQAEREHFELQGIQSIIAVPMVLNDNPVGFLGFDAVSQKKKWTNEDKAILRIVGEVFSNAIDRKQMETSLKESEERYRHLFHQSPVGFLHVDNKGAIVDVNASYERIIGNTREKLIGFDTYRVGDANMKRAMDKALSGDTGYYTGEFRSILTGNKIACNLVTQGIRDANGNVTGAIVIMEDITEQKKLQESLRRSEFYLKQAQSVAGVGSWHLDIPNDTLIWSDQIYSMFGVDRQTPLNIYFFMDHVHPEDRQKVESAWQAAMKGEPYDMEHRIIANGKVRWIHEKAQITLDKDGSPLEGIGTVHDITRRKLAERALQESEKRFRAIFDQAAVGVLLSSMDTGSILQANQKFCKIIGYSETELKNITIREITHPADLQAQLDKMEQIKEGKLKDFSMEKRYLGKDGSVIWVNLTVSPMWHGDKKATQYITVIEDITQRKMMEAEMKTLSGLLPICSSCKKIRDDSGYWTQIESYIREHSDANFSHSICPECRKKLYPEYE